ncbi:serine/threonine-protein kinase Sgk2b isoform X5 [Syngnathoides biaculeatus]|uniref:serine/threonine-protein kinase Sgk2b isoform X5 n=1 Tax=Syngnathoides biaculeatus TaxID=300417 RepID=UPI002ADDEBFC|nr:serine/threonine-protein kinase Sgk2b isoform X5 [Syngnathoides biaculeatus]
MTRTRGRAMTCAEMRRLASFFAGLAALLKGRKFLFRELLHKVAPYQPLCQHQEDACRIRRPRSKKWEKLRDGSGRGTAVSKENGSLKSQTSRMKPSDFDYLKVIGKGSFGKVLLAKHRKDGGCYAVKVLHKQTIVMRKEQQHVMVERSVLLKGLQHPFLVGLRFAFQTPNLLYFVVDYVNGGELFYHLQNEGSFPESRAAFYAAEISMALGYLHSLDVVYRDLKPENILLDCEGHVKLTDFGLCKEGVAAGEVMQTFCGTPEYLAPEVLLGHAYGPAVDWWGLGSVLFEMLYGHPPFYSRSKAEMFAKIVHEPLRLRSGTSEAARSLLGGLLERKVSRRLGERRDVEELREHPFFSYVDWDDLLAKKVAPPFVPNVVIAPADGLCPQSVGSPSPSGLSFPRRRVLATSATSTPSSRCSPCRPPSATGAKRAGPPEPSSASPT